MSDTLAKAPARLSSNGSSGTLPFSRVSQLPLCGSSRHVLYDPHFLHLRPSRWNCTSLCWKHSSNQSTTPINNVTTIFNFLKTQGYYKNSRNKFQALNHEWFHLKSLTASCHHSFSLGGSEATELIWKINHHTLSTLDFKQNGRFQFNFAAHMWNGQWNLCDFNNG